MLVDKYSGQTCGSFSGKKRFRSHGVFVFVFTRVSFDFFGVMF